MTVGVIFMFVEWPLTRLESILVPVPSGLAVVVPDALLLHSGELRASTKRGFPGDEGSYDRILRLPGSS